MTTVTSPKDQIAAHRHRMRQAAAAAGTPVLRSRFRAIPFEPTGIVYLNDLGPMYRPTGAKAVPLDFDLLRDIVTEDGRTTAIADMTTFARLRGVVSKAKADPRERSHVERALTITDGLESSVRMPVLTKALAHRFWLPDGLDENSVDDWAAAFGSTPPTLAMRIHDLLRADAEATTAHPSLMGVTEKNNPLANLLDIESRLMKDARYTNTSTSCDIFSKLERHKNIHDGIRTADPGLLEIHAMDGQASRLVVLGLGAEARFEASVSDPFKLKEGSVRITDGNTIVNSDLLRLKFAQDTMHAVFRLPKKGRDMVHAAERGVGVLYAMGGIYSSGPRPRTENKWTSGDTVARIGRTVPLDVIVAGAPAE